MVMADRSRLGRAVWHLLDNAVKFTPAGGTITVGAAMGGGMAEIRVADTGPGIPLADQQRIFQPFVQADSTESRPEGGTGLGLSIAAQIVRQHGGSITVQSEPGKGSTFIIRLRPAEVLEKEKAA
jgi:signal transduction histidine kinase